MPMRAQLMAAILVPLLSSCGAEREDRRSASRDEEGAESLAIVGGTTASTAIRARTVALTTTDGTLCSATILDTKTVLTAAHCVSGKTPKTITFGASMSSSTTRTAGTATIHASYGGTGETIHDDVAIVSFSGGIPSGFQAVELYDDASYVLATGTSIVQSGYGYTLSGSSSSGGTLNQNNAYLASYATQGYYVWGAATATCSGDSGGPDFYQDGSMLVQIGTHSASDCASFSISMDLRNFKSWLVSKGADVLSLPSPTLRAQLPTSAADLDATYKLRYDATLSSYTNLRGHQEKYFQDASNNYYVLLPDGTFLKWMRSFSASFAVARVDTSYYTYPKSLTEASERADVQPTAASLATTYVLGLADGGVYTNARGAQEKYLRGKSLSSANAGWYFILPTGSLYAWGGGTDLVNGTLVGVVDPSYYTNPVKLVAAAATLATDAVALQSSLSLTYTSTYDSYTNHRGHGEKYLMGTGTNSGWYFLVSDGTLFQWKGSVEASVPVASLATSYYTNPKLLVEAVQRAGAQPTAASLAARYAFAVPENYYYNYRGSLEKYIRGSSASSTNGWYYVLPDGSVYAWKGSLVDSTLLGVVATSYYTDVTTLISAK